MGMFGTVVFVLLAILAIVGPRYIAQWGYNEVDRGHYLESPSTRHWLGTTQDGRDLFALSMRGLGKSMIIGLTVALLSTTMSAIVGSFAAYFGGWFERTSLWVIDLLLVLPSFIIIAVLLRNVSPGNSIWLLIVLLTLLGWMLTARVVRSLTMSLPRPRVRHGGEVHGRPRTDDRDPPHHPQHLVAAHRRRHGRAWRPRCSPRPRCRSSASASVLPETSLGTLIGQGARQATTFPWIFYAGAIPLVLLVLSVNFMGDGLRDALDPTSAKASGKA